MGKIRQGIDLQGIFREQGEPLEVNPLTKGLNSYRSSFLINMAINDLYNSEKRYNFIRDILINQKKILEKPSSYKQKYYCKNPANLKYFKKLLNYFEINDLAYIRRLAVLNFFKFLVYHFDKDIKDLTLKDKDYFVLCMRDTYKSHKQLERSAIEVNSLGRILFYENKIPAFFDKFKIRFDSSMQQSREDKLTPDEFLSIMHFFSKDPVTQCYLSIAVESLVRPQELLYCKIKDLSLLDKYGIIHINSHGKEGLKKLLCIESYPYLLKMLEKHPFKSNPEAFLFINKEKAQLTNISLNKRLRVALKQLKIDKPVTAYSFKRYGVTSRRLKGDSDTTIQKIAGWKSTKQIRTYDLSDQDDIFKQELVKKGLLDGNSENIPMTKDCPFCSARVGFAEQTCPNCKRVIDTNLIKKELESLEDLKAQLNDFLEIKEELLIYKTQFASILDIAEFWAKHMMNKKTKRVDFINHLNELEPINLVSNQSENYKNAQKIVDKLIEITYRVENLKAKKEGLKHARKKTIR